MKYMLLVCRDDTADASGMAPVEPWAEVFGDRGTRLHGHRLDRPAEAVTVRVRSGEVLRTDGSFAETKEYVAGLDILECDSLEEAIEAAREQDVERALACYAPGAGLFVPRTARRPGHLARGPSPG
ncbi:YciI family protein [Streptomyces sp. SD15]